MVETFYQLFSYNGLSDLVRTCRHGRKNDLHEARKLNPSYFLCSHLILYLRTRVDRLRWRQRPDPQQFSDHHHLTSRGGSQPALFGFTQRFGRRAPLHLVRLADASCQSLVGYGNRRNHRHTDDGGNHDTHVYAARQLGPFPNRPTNAQLNDSFRPPAVLAITTTSLPNGTVNQAYNRPVQASGGTPPLTWNIVAGTGTLPPGLNLNPTTGAISGTPTMAGTSSFTVRVADARGQSDIQALSITISTAPPPPNPPNITTTTLPAGTVGQPYSQPVQVTGGTGALTWSIVAGQGHSRRT